MSPTHTHEHLIEYLVPVVDRQGETSVEALKSTPTLRGATVGFLVNSFDCSRTFFEAVAAELEKNYGIARFVMKYKRDKSLPAENHLLEELKATCDMVVDGVQI